MGVHFADTGSLFLFDDMTRRQYVGGDPRTPSDRASIAFLWASMEFGALAHERASAYHALLGS